MVSSLIYFVVFKMFLLVCVLVRVAPLSGPMHFALTEIGNVFETSRHYHSQSESTSALTQEALLGVLSESAP